MSWQVSNTQWRQWIDEDATTPRIRWVSCDEFDERLRLRLELHPFLGTSENTIVGRSEETMATTPPVGGGDSFDSMATVVRMAPQGLQVPEPEAAQTLVHGTLEDAEPVAGDEAASGLEVSVEGGGYQVELESQAPGVAPAPGRSGQTLRTEPVPGQAATDGPLPTPPAAVDIPGLYIPTLTRTVAQAHPAQPAPAESEAQEAVAQAQPLAPLEATPAEPVEVTPAEPVESPATFAEPGVVEPVSPASSGTMVVMPPEPGELEAPVHSGRTVIVQTPSEPAAAHAQFITPIAPEPSAAPQQAYGHPDPAATDSQTSGVIEPAEAVEISSDVEAPADKVVVDTQPSPWGAALSDADSDAIDATEIVEEEVEEVEDEGFEADTSAPPVPPPAPVREESAPPATAEPSVATPIEMGRKPASRKVAGWYDEVFAEHFAALRRKGLGKMAKAEVDFFLQGSGIAQGATVLDVGCGDGAHAITLAQRGYHVTAVDNASAQLSRATSAARQLQVGIDFQAADMRDMELGKFDGIICLGTTFGYFDDDVNRSVLRRLREHLRPDGRMMLQVFNRDYVAPRLPSRSWWQGHGCLVLDETQMNYFNNRLHVHRTVVFEDGRQFEHNMYVRAYGAYELGRMCVDTGLRVVEISGSRHTRSRFYGATSPEIWLLVGRA